MYFRKLKKYTQEELAFRASISASYLSRIERGVYKKGLPVSTLMKIAKALDIEVSVIFEK
nr:helix-turn-helix transcriptional regulator [Megamonas funiformis]